MDSPHLTHDDCLDGPEGCSGPVEYCTTDGLKFWPRCAGHFSIRLDREAMYRDHDSSFPPSWFDPTYAGERWDDDY